MSDAVDAYLDALPADRREALNAVRAVVLRNLPDGYVETFNWGMISYEVPLTTCPDTYNGKPLMLAAIGSQKRHMAVYLTAIYMDADRAAAFDEQYRATGKRMDRGKSCVRFKRLEDLPLSLIGETIAAVPVADFIAAHHRQHAKKRSR